ncbi:Gfo/Idh/MocA family protein [Cohnella sp. GCM10020058]|uniref:Gfo/Idh/MocA family protein n=1 Tax=Cohnella sp. GCM10020058 TaxID=3317330 RepID=UPI003627E4B2
MNGNKRKGAVIGYGGAFNMGKAHAEQMIAAGIEFVAACDLDAARAAQAGQDFPGIGVYTRVEDLLARDDIDVVTVITPHNTHAPLATQVLESGKHCILEKPMCIFAEDADRLVRLAADKGLMLSVYHNRRWDGWYLAVQDLIRKDILGDIFHVEMYHGGYYNPGTWWRSDKAISGGVFYDWGAHYLDWLLGLLPGKIASVRGFIHKRVWYDVSNEDQMDSIIAYEDGAVAFVQQSSIARLGKAHRRILGTQGAVVDYGDGSLTLQTEVNGLQVESKIPYFKDRHDAFYKNVASHLTTGAALTVTPEQTRRIIAVIETTERSAKAGKELPVPYE